jgi:hypothetical protein
MSNSLGVISQYMEKTFTHYNSLNLLNSANSLKQFTNEGRKVMIQTQNKKPLEVEFNI